MTSRPAAPESETPETDALIEDMLHGAGIPRCDEWDRLLANAKKFERQHSLAQTEIKGHMRIEDDLKAEIVMLNGIIRVRGEAIAKAQSRIAALEKVLEERDAARLSILWRLRNQVGGPQSPLYYHTFNEWRAAIDAALKDRA